MINYQVLKHKAVSRRVLELSCTQTDRQTTRFTSADPLASQSFIFWNSLAFNEAGLLTEDVGAGPDAKVMGPSSYHGLVGFLAD